MFLYKFEQTVQSDFGVMPKTSLYINFSEQEKIILYDWVVDDRGNHIACILLLTRNLIVLTIEFERT